MSFPFLFFFSHSLMKLALNGIGRHSLPAQLPIMHMGSLLNQLHPMPATMSLASPIFWSLPWKGKDSPSEVTTQWPLGDWLFGLQPWDMLPCASFNTYLCHFINHLTDSFWQSSTQNFLMTKEYYHFQITPFLRGTMIKQQTGYLCQALPRYDATRTCHVQHI